MNFQILDADYVRENEKLVIRLFGRDEEGESVCCFVPGFEPYFYVNVSGELQDVGKIIQERFEAVKTVEVVQKFEPIGYQKQKKPMLKVTTLDPKNVPEIRDDIAALPGVKEVYETDILFRNRFLIDRGFNGMGWVSAETAPDAGSFSSQNLTCDRTITASSVREIEKISGAPLKYLAFDIECLPLENAMPTAETSPIIMVSLAFEPSYEEHSTLVLVGKEVKDADPDVEMFTDEAKLLNRFFEIFQKYDPDMVIGYNINDFDIPYITDRVKFLNESSGSNIRSNVGRDGRSMSYRRIGNRTMVSMPGRVVVDALPLARQGFSLKQYTLRNVAKELLGREKLDVAFHEMREYWEDSGEKIKKFIDYSRRDSELALELVLKLQLLDKYVALAQVSGTLLQDTISGGQSSMVENLMLREFGKRDRVIPPRPDDSIASFRHKQSEELKGGEVLDPWKGLLENVVILDYKSLYPTIMMAHNLCYTSVVERDRPDGETVKPPSGGEFVSASVSKGIVPSILEDLLNRRTETKKRMKDAASEEEIRVLDATQYALKILLNSFYGYSGYTRARLYSLQLANAVTSYGRANILNTRTLVNDTIHRIVLRNGNAYLTDEIASPEPSDNIITLSVVYGDTDSVFVKCSSDREISLEDAELVGNKIAGIVSDSLPDPMELEFESIAKRALFIAKKRYAIWVFERAGEGWSDKIKVKGMETVRRDWCELTSKTLNKVLELVLKEGKVDIAVEYVRSIVDRVRNIDARKDSQIIDDLTLTRMFSKGKRSYKSKQPHLTVVEKIEARTGVAPSIGERIPFVIIAGKGLFVERAEDPGYVREHNIPLDVDYYIKKQMLPPVERILAAFGVDMATLDYDSKQKGLFDFVPAGKRIAKRHVKNNSDNGTEAAPNQKSQSSLFDF
ncbi:MAG: DNA polymerase elongation subunit [Methanosarcinaceae archaeon]|nr:DNA polymerase elongation subunit [Methanosarcinaceae archaeon]